MFTRSLGTRRIVQNSTSRYFGGYGKHAPAAAAAPVQAKEDHFVSAFHIGRPIDLSQVHKVFGDAPKVHSGPNFVKVLTNPENKEGFDVFSYGSIVFYNTKRDAQRSATAQILGLGVDAAIAPYQMEGYDNYDTLLELSLESEKVVLYHLNQVDMNVWHAVGTLFARNSALQFYDAALDRVIDGIFTLSEDELRGHISYITENVNSINVLEDPKFDTPSASAIYANMKQEYQPETLYSEFHFKQAVLRNQYKITGATELQGTAA